MDTDYRGQTLCGCEHGRKYSDGDKPYVVKQQVFEQVGEHW